MGLGDMFKFGMERGVANAESGNVPRWVGLLAIFLLGICWAVAISLLFTGSYWAIPVLALAVWWSYSTWKQRRAGKP